jgi:hypothetical protein
MIVWALTVWCAGCTQDLYQQRTTMMKGHIKGFYDHLGSDRVKAAVLENERLEGLASTVGAEIRQSRQSLADNQVNRDWVLLKTAHEAAAENWLNLGRYFAHHKQYDEARGAYRRVLTTYRDEAFRAYREQANAGIHDLDMMSSPSGSH